MVQWLNWKPLWVNLMFELFWAEIIYFNLKGVSFVSKYFSLFEKGLKTKQTWYFIKVRTCTLFCHKSWRFFFPLIPLVLVRFINSFWLESRGFYITSFLKQIYLSSWLWFPWFAVHMDRLWKAKHVHLLIIFPFTN